MGVTLAGAGIDVRCDAGTGPLADVFLAGDAVGAAPDADGGADRLTLTMRVDGPLLDAAVRGDEEGSVHLRRGVRDGDEHTWLVPRPRHLQRLTLGGGGGGGASHRGAGSDGAAHGGVAHAELVVDAGSVADGTVRARPGVHAIATWAAGRGVMPVHAAAVARDGRALLLIGAGGRGKTTTAMSLALRGWRLIADDLCFLAPSPTGTVVHGLYATAVLTPPMAERLGASTWEGLGRTHVGKVAVRLPAELPVAREATLTAVVTVGHDDGEPYRTSVLPHRDAHAAWQEAFAPALQTHGPTPALLAAYARAARALPVTRMTLGWDVGRIDGVLTGLLDGGLDDGGLLTRGTGDAP